MLKETIRIIGPCSKYIDGLGWTTDIKIKQLEECLLNQGYKIIKLEENKNE